MRTDVWNSLGHWSSLPRSSDASFAIHPSSTDQQHRYVHPVHHLDVRRADTNSVPRAHGSSMNYAFNADNSLGVSATVGLPIFRAGIDSCCTASCTDSLDKLVNVRECD